MPRIEIAVDHVDGTKEVVRVGRPVDLIAFADKFGKVAPDGPYVVKEAAWLVHRATKVAQPFEEWLEGLDDVNVVQTSENGDAPDPTESSPESAEKSPG
jgi:hypothetical protein